MDKNNKNAEESTFAVTSETAKEFDEEKEIENLKKIEAALFLSARFLNLQELVLLTDINPLMLRELIEKLIEKYNKEDSAIEIIKKENIWKMDVRQEYTGMVNKLATGTSEFTKAEQETLAVIAYKQPVKQSVVIKIRGNKAYEHIKHFIDIGLVISKRAGHTLELRLSDDFFEYFHLQNRSNTILNDHSDSENYEESEDLQSKGEKIAPVKDVNHQENKESRDEDKEDIEESEDIELR